MKLSVNGNRGTDRSPVVQESSFRGFHINTAMRHGSTEIIVPIGTVKTKAELFGISVIVKEHNIGNVGEIVVGSKRFRSAGHFLRADFSPDFKSTVGGAVPFSGRNQEAEYLTVTLVGKDLLGSKIDLDSFIADIGIGSFTENSGGGLIVGRDQCLLIVKDREG